MGLEKAGKAENAEKAEKADRGVDKAVKAPLSLICTFLTKMV